MDGSGFWVSIRAKTLSSGKCRIKNSTIELVLGKEYVPAVGGKPLAVTLTDSDYATAWPVLLVANGDGRCSITGLKLWLQGRNAVEWDKLVVRRQAEGASPRYLLGLVRASAAETPGAARHRSFCRPQQAFNKQQEQQQEPQQQQQHLPELAMDSVSNLGAAPEPQGAGPAPDVAAAGAAGAAAAAAAAPLARPEDDRAAASRSSANGGRPWAHADAFPRQPHSTGRGDSRQAEAPSRLLAAVGPGGAQRCSTQPIAAPQSDSERGPGVVQLKLEPGVEGAEQQGQQQGQQRGPQRGQTQMQQEEQQQGRGLTGEQHRQADSAQPPDRLSRRLAAEAATASAAAAAPGAGNSVRPSAAPAAADGGLVVRYRRDWLALPAAARALFPLPTAVTAAASGGTLWHTVRVYGRRLTRDQAAGSGEGSAVGVGAYGGRDGDQLRCFDATFTEYSGRQVGLSGVAELAAWVGLEVEDWVHLRRCEVAAGEQEAGLVVVVVERFSGARSPEQEPAARGERRAALAEGTNAELSYRTERESCGKGAQGAGDPGASVGGGSTAGESRRSLYLRGVLYLGLRSASALWPGWAEGLPFKEHHDVTLYTQGARELRAHPARLVRSRQRDFRLRGARLAAQDVGVRKRGAVGLRRLPCGRLLVEAWQGQEGQDGQGQGQQQGQQGQEGQGRQEGQPQPKRVRRDGVAAKGGTQALHVEEDCASESEEELESEWVRSRRGTRRRLLRMWKRNSGSKHPWDSGSGPLRRPGSTAGRVVLPGDASPCTSGTACRLRRAGAR